MSQSDVLWQTAFPVPDCGGRVYGRLASPVIGTAVPGPCVRMAFPMGPQRRPPAADIPHPNPKRSDPFPWRAINLFLLPQTTQHRPPLRPVNGRQAPGIRQVRARAPVPPRQKDLSLPGVLQGLHIPLPCLPAPLALPVRGMFPPDTRPAAGRNKGAGRWAAFSSPF